MADRLLYRPAEVEELLALGSTKVAELIATGQLASISVGRCRRVTRSSLMRFIGEQARIAAGAPPTAPRASTASKDSDQ
jgi:excisionase family DNA binding protein